MKKSIRRAVAISMMFLFFLLLIIFGAVTKGHATAPEDLKYLTGWDIREAEKTADSYYAADRRSYILEMRHELTEDMYGKVISFRTNDSYLDAYCVSEDGKTPLYHFGEQISINESPGTYTHFIPLPDSGSGTVLIRIETVYKNKFLKEYDVAIGSKNELIYGYLRSEAVSVIPNVLLLTFGVLLLIVYFVSVGMHSPIPEALSLSALTIAFTLFNNCPLFANQYIFQNAITQYYLNYFSLYMLPLLAILYFEDIVPGLDMKWLFYVFVGLAAVLSAAHFTGIASYTRSIKIFSASLGVFAVISIIMIAGKFSKISVLNRIALVTLLVFLFVNVLFFIFVSTLGKQSTLSKIGMLLYIAIAIVNGLHKLMKGFFKTREDELLHEIAYLDNLTRLGSRYALERDAQKMPLENISIVSLDLNYLKYTNDTYGHAGGDVLLKSAAKCISSVYDKVYRVGGDEFIALVSASNPSALELLAVSLQTKVSEFNRERTSFEEFAVYDDFVLSIAAGFASYESDDTTYEQIMRRADDEMYQNKKKDHAESGRMPKVLHHDVGDVYDD